MNEHLNKDSVAAAFKLVMEELDKANQEITKQITQASMNADYEKGQVLLDRGKNLKAFQTRVNALRQEWIDGIDILEDPPEDDPPPKIYRPPNAPQTKLRVTFPYGERIERNSARNTFVETIQKIGIDKVRKLGLHGNGVPLIDSAPRRDGKTFAQQKIQGWYICLYSGTRKKKEQLDEIAQHLGIRLKVEIISKDKSTLF